MHLPEKTRFVGNITESTKVCMSCYKSHLQILREIPTVSTDDDLLALINQLQKITTNELIKTTDDVINNAIYRTTLYVGRKLLQQEALLLPSVCEVFSGFVSDFASAANLYIPGTFFIPIHIYRWE